MSKIDEIEVQVLRIIKFAFRILFAFSLTDCFVDDSPKDCLRNDISKYPTIMQESVMRVFCLDGNKWKSCNQFEMTRNVLLMNRKFSQFLLFSHSINFLKFPSRWEISFIRLNRPNCLKSSCKSLHNFSDSDSKMLSRSRANHWKTGEVIESHQIFFAVKESMELCVILN